MTGYVALLRAVNVGGRRVTMPELRLLAEGLGLDRVSTYLNSGNLLLSTPDPPDEVARALEAGIERRFGFAVPVLMRTRERLRAVLDANPYPDGDPSRVVVAFLAGPPERGALERMAEVATAAERFARVGADVGAGAGEVVLELGDGQARSVLAARLPRLLGVVSTVRNVRTVGALADRLAD